MRKTLKERFDEKWVEDKDTGCWVWIGGLMDKRYGVFHYNKKAVNAHRVSYELYCEPIPEGMIICHKCDNTFCVNPDHLFVGSHKDNTKDMYKKNRQNPFNKIKKEDILNIFFDKRTNKEVAEDFNISTLIVRNIRNRKTFKWLTNNLNHNDYKRDISKKLSEEDVIIILNDKRDCKIIAEDFNICVATVYNIKNGHCWSNITNNNLNSYFKKRTHKLNKNQIISIFKDNRKFVIIAKDYNISHATVSRIKSGKSYASFTKDLSAS